MEDQYRLVIFVATFGLFALLELLAPQRKEHPRKLIRWRTNLLLIAVDTVAIRFVLPLVAVSAAVIAEQEQIGLAYILSLPNIVAIILTIILFDGLIWLQHLVFHKVPFLWRMHRVHHSDTDIDLTTGIRFHPFEMILSMAFKIALVFAFGAPVAGVFLYEVILLVMALFNHANLHLPEKFDARLRLFVVTPAMHRVHHSSRPKETDSNYGNFLSIWDHLFHTYIAEPKGGIDKMTIGLNSLQDERPSRLFWNLAHPFMKLRSTKSAPDQPPNNDEDKPANPS